MLTPDMSDGASEIDTLPIRCPGCGQRFRVGPDLMGRMVECGTCEHRFRVGDDVIVRQKKYYPGERRDRSLDRFSRVPMASSQPAGFQAAHYAPETSSRAIEPTTPMRLLCGLAAILVVVGAAGLLMLGGRPGGVLDGTDQTKRLALAVFAALVAAAFTVAANPSQRFRAILASVAVAAGLISLPFFFKQGTSVLGLPSGPRDEVSELIKAAGAPKDTPPVDAFEDLRKEIGCEPLEKEILRYEKSSTNDGRTALGVWLRDLPEYNKLLVRDYIIRAMEADPSSYMYPRPPDYLMVVSGVPGDLNALAKVCERFGEVRRKLSELNVVEVYVNNDSFLEGPLDKLTDRSGASFYDLNRRELESIDLKRAQRAVVRIADAEPKAYRKDIVRRLQQLLKEGTLEQKIDIARALENWAEEGDGSVPAMHAAAVRIFDEKKDLPEAVVHFLSKRGDTDLIPILHVMWENDSTKWEDPYAALGSAAEPSLLENFARYTPNLKRSATRILEKAGTARCLPVLQKELPEANGELKVLLERAIAAIRSR